MRSGDEIRKDVEAELAWDPGIDATDIAVAVKDGVVTLTGFVRSYLDKCAAGEIAEQVDGVRGLANDINVRLPINRRRPDPELARDAMSELEKKLPTTHERITVTAKDGWVTLEGAVEWPRQKERAEQIVRRLRGVRAVTNALTVAPTTTPEDLKRKIEAALMRIAENDADQIIVEANGGDVTLLGMVKSWLELRAAEDAAWRAPGVTRVINLLTLQP